MKYFIGIVGLLILGGVGWYFSNTSTVTESQNTDNKTKDIRIAASIYPLAYITERLLGDKGMVTNVGAGQDPHDFRPSVRDIRTMQDADVVVLQGAEFEPWGEDVSEQLKNTGTQIVIATADLDLFEMKERDRHNDHGDGHDDHENEHHDKEKHDEHGDEHGHEDEHEHEADTHNDHDDHAEDSHGDHHGHNHGAFDPHTWLDPVLMSQMAAHITESLVALDPDNRSVYEQNLTSLKQDLATLDQEYQSALSNCTVNEVITSHDAFGYLGRRYGFEIHTIGGLSTQDTPSAVTLANLKKEAAEGITTILLEENSIAAYGETLARETGLRTDSISPIVYNIPQGHDYMSVMRSNLHTLASALDCNE